MDPGRMDYCTSASGEARWRNVRGDRDNGTDSDFIPLSEAESALEGWAAWSSTPWSSIHTRELRKRKRE